MKRATKKPACYRDAYAEIGAVGGVMLKYAVVILFLFLNGCARKPTVDVFEPSNPSPQQPPVVEKKEEKPQPAVTYPYPIQRYTPSMPLDRNDQRN